MSWFAGLRTIVYARRAVVALERIAIATELQAQLAVEAAARAAPKMRKSIVDFGALDQSAATDQWKRDRLDANLPIDEDELAEAQ